MSLRIFTAAFLASFIALPAQADADLGILGATLRLGASDHIAEGGFAGGTVDVAITDHHGAQFDLQYEERANGGIGRLGTTLYMTPKDGHKYGLNLMVADKNDASATYGQIGAVGMLSLSDGVDLELRAGAGLSASNDLDWITAGAGLHWQATTGTQIYGHYDITEFDERDMGAVGHEITLGLQTQLGSSPASLFVEATHDRLEGRSAAPGVTTLRAGVALTLGGTGNDQPTFRVHDPVRQLIRRSMF